MRSSGSSPLLGLAVNAVRGRVELHLKRGPTVVLAFCLWDRPCLRYCGACCPRIRAEPNATGLPTSARFLSLNGKVFLEESNEVLTIQLCPVLFSHLGPLMLPRVVPRFAAFPETFVATLETVARRAS